MPNETPSTSVISNLNNTWGYRISYSDRFLQDQEWFWRSEFFLAIFEQDTGSSPGKDCYSCVHQQSSLAASLSKYERLVKQKHLHSCGNHKPQQRQGTNHAS